MASRPSIRTDDVLYSTRTCRRCGVAMTATADRRERRVWHCPTCGDTQR